MDLTRLPQCDGGPVHCRGSQGSRDRKDDMGARTEGEVQLLKGRECTHRLPWHPLGHKPQDVTDLACTPPRLYCTMCFQMLLSCQSSSHPFIPHLGILSGADGRATQLKLSWSSLAAPLSFQAQSDSSSIPLPHPWSPFLREVQQSSEEGMEHWGHGWRVLCSHLQLPVQGQSQQTSTNRGEKHGYSGECQEKGHS